MTKKYQFIFLIHPILHNKLEELSRKTGLSKAKLVNYAIYKLVYTMLSDEEKEELRKEFGGINL